MRIRNSSSEMKEVFTACQSSSASHGKLLKQLTKIYHQDTLDDFTTTFTNLLTHCLIIGDKQPAVDRTLDFCVKFATSIGSGKDNDDSSQSDDTNPFLIELFEFMLKHSCAASQAVRFRVCQMIQKLLNALSDDATIDDELFTRIYDCMLERLRDKAAGIRVQAVFALQRLQEPGNKECPVIKAYIHHLHKDPHQDVRRAVLMNIASSIITLSHVLDRCKDISDAVRKQAYILIADKISIKSLSISQREKLVKMGLKDRSVSVREIVEKRLLPAWLNRAETHIGFLRMLDVESSYESIDFALQTMFKSKSPKELIDEILLGEERLIPKEALSSHVVLYWRSLATYFQSNGFDENLEMILPELTNFVNYVKSYILEPSKAINESQSVLDDATVALHYEFVSNQLICMMDVFDKSDESGRRHLLNTLRELLLHDDVTPRIARPLVRCYSTLENSPETRTITLLEIIADIREPMADIELTPQELEMTRETELQLARLKVRLNVQQDELETAIKDENFGEAQRLKEEMKETKAEMEKLTEIPVQCSQQVREERRDPQTLSKCLEIVSELLQSSQIKKLSPGIRSLLDNFILSCVSHEDPEVRHSAIKNVGICCTLDKNVAQNHCLLLTEAAQVDPFAAIRMTAVRVLFDLVSQYGLELFVAVEEDEVDVLPTLNSRKNSPDVSGFLIGLLDNESEMQTLATEGLCKLLLIGRIQSSALLSRLLLQWYHPLTVGDEARHILGVFFSAFPAISKANQELFVGAFKPTLKTIINAPIHSPVAMIDLGEIVKKFVLLTSDYILMSSPAEGDSNVHDSLALSFCQEILRHPDAPHSKILIKLLASLQPALPNRVFVDDLRTLIRRILEVLRDRVVIRLVEKFDQRLESRQETFSTQEEGTSTPTHVLVNRSLSNETTETLDSSASLRRRHLMSRHQSVFGDDEEEEPLARLTDHRESVDIPLPRSASDVDIPSESDLSMVTEEAVENQPQTNKAIDEAISAADVSMPSDEVLEPSQESENPAGIGTSADAASPADVSMTSEEGLEPSEESGNPAGIDPEPRRTRKTRIDPMSSQESLQSDRKKQSSESEELHAPVSRALKSARKQRVHGVQPPTQRKRVQVSAPNDTASRAYPKTPKAAPKSTQKVATQRSSRRPAISTDSSEETSSPRNAQKVTTQRSNRLATASPKTARKTSKRQPDDDSSEEVVSPKTVEPKTARKTSKRQPVNDSSEEVVSPKTVEPKTARKTSKRQPVNDSSEEVVLPKTAEPKTARKTSRRQLIGSGSSNEIIPGSDSDAQKLKSARVVIQKIPDSLVTHQLRPRSVEKRPGVMTEPRKTRRLGEDSASKSSTAVKKTRALVLAVSPHLNLTSSPAGSTRNRLSGIDPISPGSPSSFRSAIGRSRKPTEEDSEEEISRRPKPAPVQRLLATSTNQKRRDSLWSDEDSPPARTYQRSGGSSKNPRSGKRVVSDLSSSPRRSSRGTEQTEREVRAARRDSASSLGSPASSIGSPVVASRQAVTKLGRRSGFVTMASRRDSSADSLPEVASRQAVTKPTPIPNRRSGFVTMAAKRTTPAQTKERGSATSSDTALTKAVPKTRTPSNPTTTARRSRPLTSPETSPDVRKSQRGAGSTAEEKKGEPARKYPRMRPPQNASVPPKLKKATDAIANLPNDATTDDSDEEILESSPGASERSFIPGSSMRMSVLSKVSRKRMT